MFLHLHVHKMMLKIFLMITFWFCCYYYLTTTCCIMQMICWHTQIDACWCFPVIRHIISRSSVSKRHYASALKRPSLLMLNYLSVDLAPKLLLLRLRSATHGTKSAKHENNMTEINKGSGSVRTSSKSSSKNSTMSNTSNVTRPLRNDENWAQLR